MSAETQGAEAQKETISLDDLLNLGSVAIAIEPGKPAPLPIQEGDMIFITIGDRTDTFVEGMVFCRTEEGGCLVIAQGMTYRV